MFKRALNTFLFLFIFLATTCPLDSANAENQKLLQIRLIADPETFDWTLAHTPAETPVIMNTMEGLVAFDKNMKIVPALASSWTISPDQKTYTFNLRKGVQWSDGRELKSDDFIYSWKRLLDPKVAAPYAYLLGDVATFSAINANTIRIQLKKPVSYFIQLFTFWVTYPIRQDLVEHHGSKWALPGTVTVLGPFIPTEYKFGSQLILKRNERYYGKKPNLAGVIFKIVTDDSTALNLFKSGKLDFTRPINPLELNSFENTPALHRSPYFRTCFIGFNLDRAPLQNTKIRQAIALSIDKKAFEKISRNGVRAASALVQSEIFDTGKNGALEFNPKKARALVAESKIDLSKTDDLEFVTYASDENILLAQFLQDQLKTNIGLNLKLQILEYKTYQAQLKLRKGALFHRCWGADYADPDSYFSIFTSKSDNNFVRWKNVSFDEFVIKAAGMANGSARNNIYKKAQEILLRDEAAIVPLYYDVLTYLLNPKTKNFVLNPLNYVYLKEVDYE